MLVVLDSNVFISALISPDGVPHRIFKAWRAGRFEVVTCPEQLQELRRASHYSKFRLLVPPHIFGALLNHLYRARLLDRFPSEYAAADPHDSYLLNLAAAAEAHYLVTGDKHSGLIERRRIHHARILTATAFCRTVLERQPRS